MEPTSPKRSSNINLTHTAPIDSHDASTTGHPGGLNEAKPKTPPPFMSQIKTGHATVFNKHKSKLDEQSEVLDGPSPSKKLVGVELNIDVKIEPSDNPGDTSRVRDHAVLPRGMDGESEKPFSTQRKEQMEQKYPDLKGHPALELYGRLTARNTKDVSQHVGLRMDNKHSSTYLRDTWHNDYAVKTAFDNVINLHADEVKLQDGEAAYLVNSGEVPDKLQSLVKTELEDRLGVEICRIVEFEPGLYALVYKIDTVEKYGEPVGNLKIGTRNTEFQNLLAYIGATPSIGQAKAHVFEKENGTLEIKDVDNINNTGLAKEIRESKALIKLSQIDEQLPTKAMAEAVVNLVQSLPDAKQKENPLVNEALIGINNMVNYLADHASTPQQFARGLNLLTEELNLYLTLEKPYQHDDFHQAISEIVEKRMPSMKPFVQTEQMRGSGMDALSAAISYAKETHKSQLQQLDGELNYFEVPMIVKKAGIESPSDQPIIVTGLNPSTTVGENDHTKLVKEVKSKCEKFENVTLVLDATLQKSEKELESVLSQFKEEIENGKLNILLCQSYQKYPSLGLGKVKAGGIMAINNGKTPWDACNKQINDAASSMGKLEKPEAQLMMHILKHANDSEIGLLQQASKNAKLIQEFCAQPKPGFHGYVEGLPFVLLPSSLGSRSAESLLKRVPIDHRDSFGFLQSSYLSVQDAQNKVYFRINPGQESKQGTIERFFALGHLYADGNITIKTAKAHLQSLDKITADDGAQAKELMTQLLAVDGINNPIEQPLDVILEKIQSSDQSKNTNLINFAKDFMPLYGFPSPLDANVYLQELIDNKINIRASYLLLMPDLVWDQKDVNAERHQLIDAGIDQLSKEIGQFTLNQWAKEALETSSGIPFDDDTVATLINHGGKMAAEDRLKLFEAIPWNRLNAYGSEVKQAVAKTLLGGIEAPDVIPILERLADKAVPLGSDKTNRADKVLTVVGILKEQSSSGIGVSDELESEPKFLFASTNGLLDPDIKDPKVTKVDLTKPLNQLESILQP